MHLNDILPIIDDVPDYQTFCTVDELKAGSHRLAERYPDIVEILLVGQSRQVFQHHTADRFVGVRQGKQ